jgi:hypothetical protein
MERSPFREWPEHPGQGGFDLRLTPAPVIRAPQARNQILTRPKLFKGDRIEVVAHEPIRVSIVEPPGEDIEIFSLRQD